MGVIRRTRSNRSNATVVLYRRIGFDPRQFPHTQALWERNKLIGQWQSNGTGVPNCMWCDDCATSLDRGSCVNNSNAMVVVDQILTCILLFFCISFDVWYGDLMHIVLNQQGRKTLTYDVQRSNKNLIKTNAINQERTKRGTRLTFFAGVIFNFERNECRTWDWNVPARLSKPS